LPSKKPSSGKLYVLIAAVVAVFIITEWITVFFYGHVPPGYP